MGNDFFFWASRGRIWMKIGGNQADTFPELPIQPKTVDFHKQIQKSKKHIRKRRRNIFHAEYFQSP